MKHKRKNLKKWNARDLRFASIHEAGHAIVASTCVHIRKVKRIELIPMDNGLGGQAVTYSKHRSKYTSGQDMREMIRILLAGKIAENLELGDTCAGSIEDIERATVLARLTVLCLGNSSHFPHQGFATEDDIYTVSEATQQILDAEISRIIQEEAKKTQVILMDNRDVLTQLSTLLRKQHIVCGHTLQQILSKTKKPE